MANRVESGQPNSGQPKSAMREMAERVLELAMRLTPESGQDWVAAMRRELDFVEGDWAAFWWAVGGVTVIARQLAGQWVVGRGEQIRKWKDKAMEQMGKKAGWLAAGALGMIALSGVAFGLLYWTAVSFPNLGLDRAEWTHILFIIVIPAMISLGFALWLWRRQRPMAVGILLSLAAISTHLVVHFTHHAGRH
jgi:hypothetical protein